MNVYDTSYKDFLENKKKSDKTPKSDDDIPIIFCYIPKTYLNDCFKKYNEILKLRNYKPIEWGNNNKNLEDKMKILTRIKEKKEKLKNLQEKKNVLKIDKDLFQKRYQNFIDLEKIFINKINLEEKIKSFENKNNDIKKLEEDLEQKKEDMEKDKDNLNNEKKDLEKEEEDLKKEEKDLKKEELLKKKQEDMKKKEKDMKKKEKD
jgi:hypothetical protein